MFLRITELISFFPISTFFSITNKYKIMRRWHTFLAHNINFTEQHEPVLIGLQKTVWWIWQCFELDVFVPADCWSITRFWMCAMKLLQLHLLIEYLRVFQCFMHECSFSSCKPKIESWMDPRLCLSWEDSSFSSVMLTIALRYSSGRIPSVVDDDVCWSNLLWLITIWNNSDEWLNPWLVSWSPFSANRDKTASIVHR